MRRTRPHLPLLLAEARTKAQALASAAGVKLGPITGVAEYSYGAGVPSAIFIASAVLGSISNSSSSAEPNTLSTRPLSSPCNSLLTIRPRRRLTPT